MAQISYSKEIYKLAGNSSIRKAVAGIATAGAISLIAVFEGFSNKAYLPTPNDVPTIGYGQTVYADGRKVKMGDYISEKEARTQLGVLVEKKFIQQIAKCVKVPLTENEFTAYVSLAYNIGASAFCGSTLVKKLNAGDYNGACEQIKRWNKQKGKVLKGLVKRRQQEYELCKKVG